MSSPRLMFVLLRPTILPPVSTRATSVGTFFSNSGSFFILLTRSSQRLVAASPRAAGEAFVSASSVACSVPRPQPALGPQAVELQAAGRAVDVVLRLLGELVLVAGRRLSDRTHQQERQQAHQGHDQSVDRDDLDSHSASKPPRQRSGTSLTDLGADLTDLTGWRRLALPRRKRRYHSCLRARQHAKKAGGMTAKTAARCSSWTTRASTGTPRPATTPSGPSGSSPRARPLRPRRARPSSACPPRPATDDELARVHDPRFIDALAELRGQSGYLDPDTYVSRRERRRSPGSPPARSSPWSTAMLDGPEPRGRRAAPPSRAPRAARRSAMGFCLLNNVAVAAAHARARGLAARRRRRLGRAPRQRHAGDVLAGPGRALRLDPPVSLLSGHRRRRRGRRGRGQGLHGQRPAVGRRRRRRLRERLRARRAARPRELRARARARERRLRCGARAIPSRRWRCRPRRSDGWRRGSRGSRTPPPEGEWPWCSRAATISAALEASLRCAIAGMQGEVVTEPGRAPDDDGVARAARAAKKAWAGVT